jgi:hypothetical protein
MTGKSNFFRPLPVKTTVGIDDALMSPVHDRRPEIWTSSRATAFNHPENEPQ